MEISIFDLNGLHAADKTDLTALGQHQGVLWIDVTEPSIEQLDGLQHTFGLHPLAVEDTCNEYQRPKVEEYTDHLFIISNIITYDKDKSALNFREIDIFLGKNYVISVHEKGESAIPEARRRLQEKGHPTKLISPEYLLYVLLDTVVDAYFPILDQVADDIDGLSEQVLDRPDREMLRKLFQIKRGLNEAWYVVGQHRDMFSILTRREEDLITNHDVLKYHLRDVYDHLIRIGDITAVLGDNLSNLLDLYVSSQANRLNTVINRLAIVTILIGVLTVISGFYGMNFATTWPPFSADWGVLFVLGLMALLVAGFLAVFKWLDLY